MALGACTHDSPLEPAPASSEMTQSRVQLKLSGEQEIRLATMLADVQSRLLPSLAEAGETKALHTAVQELVAALAADDAVLVAYSSARLQSTISQFQHVADVESESLLADLTAMQLALEEVHLVIPESVRSAF